MKINSIFFKILIILLFDKIYAQSGPQSAEVNNQNKKYYRIGDINCPEGYKQIKFGLCEKCPVNTISLNNSYCAKCPEGFDTKGMEAAIKCTLSVDTQDNCTVVKTQNEDIIAIQSEIDNFRKNGTLVDCSLICERINWTNFSNRIIGLSSVVRTKTHNDELTIWAGWFFLVIAFFIVILLFVSCYSYRIHNHRHQLIKNSQSSKSFYRTGKQTNFQ
jgi:hypothetical protein